MNIHRQFAVGAVLALCGGFVGSAFAATIPDYSFEDPDVGGGFSYNPVVTGVIFTGDAGITASNGFDPAPDGQQNAFLQTTGDSGAQIDISVTGLTPGEEYSFSYFDDQRSGYGVVDYTVSFDGATIATYSPEAVGWTSRTTAVFTALNSAGTLTFASPLLGYDNGAGIDAITLNVGSAGAAPEPATWALVLIGFAGLGVAARSRRRIMAEAA
jgi:hypothetical protein